MAIYVIKWVHNAFTYFKIEIKWRKIREKLGEIKDSGSEGWKLIKG